MEICMIDYIDKTMSPNLASGKIAMHSEDVYVHTIIWMLSPK